MKRGLRVRAASAVLGLLVVNGAIACGGSSSGNAGSSGESTATASTSSGATASPSAGGEAHHEEGEGHGEGHRGHGLPAGPVNDFHEVLAPLWHSADGPERTARTCTQLPALRQHATAVVDAAPPAEAQAHADAWHAAAVALRDSLGPLETECGTSQRAAVAARLGDVHTAFHHLIEQLESH